MSDFSVPDIPSWKNGAAYSFGKSPPKRLWAWEFLRRNEEYRSEWKALSQQCSALIEQYGAFESWHRYHLKEVEDAWAHSPARKAGESVKEWRSRILANESADPIRALVPEMAAAKWRVRTMYDPRKGYTAGIKFLSSAWPLLWDRLEDIDAPAPGLDGEDGTCAFVFVDLRKPISPQISLIRGELLRRQKERGIKVENIKPPWSKLGQYLRALDANNQGAARGQIAKVMYPAKANAYEDDYPVSRLVARMVREAKSFVEGRYVQLLE